jgi:cytochrome bd ubiquinol oxidase subunit I
MTLLVTTAELARIQFATTTLYHFVFVPLTLGLAPLVATMQTLWYRSGNEEWLRLTRFFGSLLLINFAIGVATGLVQEFQFGMNWSVYSKYVGDVFGAPLAIEGLAAFMLEATFLGLWIFGWDKLPRGIHLACIWTAALGTWLSAYFILVANSWMQDPVGYKIVNGHAQLTSIEHLLTSRFAVNAMVHTILASFTVAAMVIFGVACWHLRRGQNLDLFRRAARFGLIVLVPMSIINLGVGSHFGIVTTSLQPMKISAAEALWNTEQPASFSLFQIGGFTESDPTPSYSIQIPGLLSFLSTGSVHGKVVGMNQLNQQEETQHGPGNYKPDVKLIYWSMRVMAYAGSFVAFIAVVAAFLYRRRKLESMGWFLRVCVWSMVFPFIACLFGWVLTEAGRQPWIVQGLLKTVDANSPSVSSAMIALSLTVFVALYVVLGIVDFWLMRRYARLDPPEPEDTTATPEPAPVPAMSF